MSWKPDREAALRTLIRETIRSAGAMSPAEIPHVVKARLKDQAGEDTDLDRLIKEILKEQREADGS